MRLCRYGVGYYMVKFHAKKCAVRDSNPRGQCPTQLKRVALNHSANRASYILWCIFNIEF